jgi:adenine-specific DNA-methyltransferase
MDFDQILLGDCLDLLLGLPDESVDLVVSSPPYNIGKEYEKRKPLDVYLAGQREVLSECVRVLKPTGSVMWQVGSYVGKEGHIPLDIRVFPILESLGLIPRNRIVWIRPHGVHAKNRFSCRHETMMWFTKSDGYVFNLDPIRVPQKYPNKTEWEPGENYGKKTGNPLGKNPGDVWAFRNVRHNHEEQTVHPCQFPEDLIERVVLSCTDDGAIVLDPYMGVGTVAVVAKRLGRRFLGAEIDPEYHAVALHRLSGEPDAEGCFPNLRTLRDWAERKGIEDLSRYSFTRQTGRTPSPRSAAKIKPEHVQLGLFTERTEFEADHAAYKRIPPDGSD